MKSPQMNRSGILVETFLSIKDIFRQRKCMTQLQGFVKDYSSSLTSIVVLDPMANDSLYFFSITARRSSLIS